MGQIHKINDVYYIEFYARGLLYSQVAGHTQAEAERLLKEIEAKIAGGEALTIVRLIELADFFERFQAQIFGSNGQTLKRFSSLIEHFQGFIKQEFPSVHQLSQITPATVEAYKSYLIKHQKSKVVNLSLLLLRDVLEFGIKLGFIHDNPTLHVRLVPWPPASERKLTERYAKARQLLAQRIGLLKLSQLLNVPDAGRLIYFSPLIPLSREDAYH